MGNRLHCCDIVLREAVKAVDFVLRLVCCRESELGDLLQKQTRSSVRDQWFHRHLLVLSSPIPSTVVTVKVYQRVTTRLTHTNIMAGSYSLRLYVRAYPAI